MLSCQKTFCHKSQWLGGHKTFHWHWNQLPLPTIFSPCYCSGLLHRHLSQRSII